MNRSTHRFPWQFSGWPAESPELNQLAEQIDFEPWLRHGNLPRWVESLQQLPDLPVDSFELSRWVGPRSAAAYDEASLISTLEQLKPWRKGPYQFFDTPLDTEWRSDLKWNRIQDHIPVGVNHALDVGCGSGYHMWRLLEAGCQNVLGVDPSILFAIQFAALQRYAKDKRIEFWPIPLEALPASEHFDLVLSMGVLYHRRSPIDHLTQLKDQMTSGGRLILETLVIEGDDNQVLVPDDRYARMRNCWFIPSVQALTRWLERCGFSQIECIDVNWTEPTEQRSTHWSSPQSLIDSLDPNDPRRTDEGHPAPLRATLVAHKP